MSTLERRYARLLRAYPASYRKERGDEILGTLLESAPAGQDWPAMRDTRSLLVGGLRTRAAQHQRLSAVANIRLAVLLGVAIYLSLAAAGYLTAYLYDELAPAGGIAAWSVLVGPPAWAALVAGLLLAAAVITAWLSRRRAVVLSCALAAVAAVTYCGIAGGFRTSRVFSAGPDAASMACQLLCLVVLTALVRRSERPDRAWLAFTGLFVAAEVLPGLGLVTWGYLASTVLLLAILVVSIACIGMDARPAIGLATYLALITLEEAMQRIRLGFGIFVPYPYLVIAVAIAVPAVWRLRRHSLAAVQ